MYFKTKQVITFIILLSFLGAEKSLQAMDNTSDEARRALKIETFLLATNCLPEAHRRATIMDFLLFNNCDETEKMHLQLALSIQQDPYMYRPKYRSTSSPELARYYLPVTKQALIIEEEG